MGNETGVNSMPAQQQTQQQTQTQTQMNSLLVNIQGASDPAFERRVFDEIATAGTQLGRISDVLNMVLNCLEQADLDVAGDAESARKLDNFRTMYGKIRQEKARRAPERLIETLKELQVQDTKAFQTVASQLKQWLNDQADI